MTTTSAPDPTTPTDPAPGFTRDATATAPSSAPTATAPPATTAQDPRQPSAARPAVVTGLIGLLAATLAFLVLLTAPASAVTVGASWRPPQVLLHFDRQETRRIGSAADTGFTPFVSSFCVLVPGGRRTWPIQAGCLTGTATGYDRLRRIFQEGRRRGRCVRVSYPVAFPVPNPAPYSRVEACR